MQKDLLSMQPELAFELQVIDIDQDPQLRERYDSLVPVLVSEAGEICHYFLDKQALLEYFSSQ